VVLGYASGQTGRQTDRQTSTLMVILCTATERKEQVRSSSSLVRGRVRALDDRCCRTTRTGYIQNELFFIRTVQTLFIDFHFTTIC